MQMSFASLLRLSVRLWLLTYLCTHVVGFALQSGPDSVGDAVAGRAFFDATNQLLYITGATTGSFFATSEAVDPSVKCYLATVNQNNSKSAFTSKQELGAAPVPEACSDFVLSESNLFLAGASLEGGLLSDLRDVVSERATVYGMLLHMNVTSNTVLGGRLEQDTAVQFPLRMTHSSTANQLFVASLISANDNPNFDYDPYAPQSYSYGTNFKVNVERYTVVPPRVVVDDGSIRETLRPSWSQTIGMDETSTFVGGLLYLHNESLVLVGSTDNGSNDLDGFVAELDPSTGQLTGRNLRIESQGGQNDQIYGACNAINEESTLYITGVTTGLLESTEERDPATEQAFIMKLQMQSNGIVVEWVRQVGATAAQAQGIACAVTSDASLVYLGGRVNDTSSQDTDLLVVQMRAQDGSVEYMHQWGSSKDDYVVDIVTGVDGNAILYGTTLGSLYRDNVELEQDVFVASVSRSDGFYEMPVAPGLWEAALTTTIVSSPIDEPVPTPTPAEETENAPVEETQDTPPIDAETCCGVGSVSGMMATASIVTLSVALVNSS